jgi:CRISPR/Cas system CSM-associated protein Csm2 small subunit
MVENDGNFEYLKEEINKCIDKSKLLLKKIKDIEEKCQNLETMIRILENKNVDKLYDEVHKLEIRLRTVEIAQGGHEEKWKNIINFAVQVIWVVMAAYILLKLGLQPPL